MWTPVGSLPANAGEMLEGGKIEIAGADPVV